MMAHDRKKAPWCEHCRTKFHRWSRPILHNRLGWLHKKCVLAAERSDVRQ